MMEFTVSKQDLNKALQKIVSIIPSKTTIPILSNILLQLENNSLTITGTDLEISISITIPVETTEKGQVTVSARVFNEIVKEFPDIPLKISSDENNKITIVTEKGVYSISGQTVDDYPKIVADEPICSLNIASDILYRLINKTSFAVSLVSYTRQITTLGIRKTGDVVNLEVDILSKYIEKMAAATKPGISLEFLSEHGFLAT